ncbi:hypothetical protein GCK72_022477 [Caenorhabditis remanei]|uniref:Uncharacterized protein n=1 Tax=Caenorhabditis remanei TaxID=31234 RepID=A0A6A5FU46_CAERE|nr:hypothetical protein GCK72_022477 [Caenorhabditis remanei]KAF1746026.1 hypothetical protein GCK72_022477 [Caenorhabditis remanei]
MKSKQQKITVIDNFCKANRYKEGIEKLHSQIETLTNLLVEGEAETDKSRHLLVKLSGKPKMSIPSEGNANKCNTKYRDAILAQWIRFQIREPALREANDFLERFLVQHVAYLEMKSKQQKITVIETFCKANQHREGIEKLRSQMDSLADLLVEDEEETEKIRDLFVELSGQPKESITLCIDCQSNINC